MTEEKKTEILKRIRNNNNLPSLSPLAVQLLEAASDDGSGARDLAKVIEKDPSLTIRLLKLVGSAYFKTVEPPTTIPQAVVRLGFKKVRIMALSLSLRDTFPMDEADGIDYQLFWKTSLYRALVAHDFAHAVDIADPDEAFVAGLISEIGMLMLYAICDERDRQGFPGKDVSLQRVIAWEEANLGINHREVARFLLRRWGFPETLVESQKYYGFKALERGLPPLSAVVELARLATEIAYGPTTDLHKLQQLAQDHLQLPSETINTIMVSAFSKVEALAQQLLIQVDSHTDILAVMEKANGTLARINQSMETSLQGLLNHIDKHSRQTEESALACQEVLENALDAVVHEIRNPLLAIGGFAKRLTQQGEAKDREKEYAKIIAQESSRLEGVLNEMTDYCEAYEPILSAENLVPLVERVLADLRAQETHGQVRIVSNLPQKPVLVSLDTEGLGRAVKRLIGHSLAMARQGADTVTVSVETARETAEVSIKITDNGRPFPQHIRNALLDSNLSAKAFTTGLGLPLARKIIQAHHGHIEVDVQKERGNTVAVYLPAL
jgi:HD-like signal output (HDOD) protein